MEALGNRQECKLPENPVWNPSTFVWKFVFSGECSLGKISSHHSQKGQVIRKKAECPSCPPLTPSPPHSIPEQPGMLSTHGPAMLCDPAHRHNVLFYWGNQLSFRDTVRTFLQGRPSSLTTNVHLMPRLLLFLQGKGRQMPTTKLTSSWTIPKSVTQRQKLMQQNPCLPRLGKEIVNRISFPNTKIKVPL